MIEDSNDDLDRFSNAVLVDSNLDKIRFVKLVSWTKYSEESLDSSGIMSIDVSNEEECEDENFFLDEWRKVTKVFLGKKESNEEEEDESSFLEIFEEEDERGNKGGKELSELRF